MTTPAVKTSPEISDPIQQKIPCCKIFVDYI
jgi:hypothetical protein